MLWYLNPRNYTRQMYTVRKPDAGRKTLSGEAEAATAIGLEKMIVDAMEEGPEQFEQARQIFRDGMDMSMGTIGGWDGQVLPLQDAEKVIEIASPKALIGCVCRQRFLGIDERSKDECTCMGLGTGMLKWERWPERYKGGTHWVSTEESKEWLRRMNKRGFVHTLMIFGNRFIGGVCNCDYPACDALVMRLDFGFFMLKGHHIAVVDYDQCNGCGLCVQRCQFGALKMNVTIDKANIDSTRCFGCGLCETICPKVAISLVERAKIPALKESW
jgi:Pyruvate/2-oxoacid:ferredoxin oxidoreductase delta subunit